MANLTTNYLGLSLKNPLLPSASPLSRNVDCIKRLEDAGAPAVVLFSLFEEQINYDQSLLHDVLEQGTNRFSESLSYLPEMEDYNIGTHSYMELIQQAKRSVSIPIIASLNGISRGGWIEQASAIQQAGADALELNLYRLPTSPTISSSQVENEYLEIIGAVREAVSIPLAVKISPFFSSIPYFCSKMADKGVQGVVIFNRFYQPDINLEELEVIHHINYSTSADLLLPLRWAAILYGNVPLDIAVTSGVHTPDDVVKSIMAGASVTMTAAELLTRGISRLTSILDDLNLWLDEHEYSSIADMRGSMSLRHVADPEKYERAQYLRVLDAYKPDDMKTFI